MKKIIKYLLRKYFGRCDYCHKKFKENDGGSGYRHWVLDENNFPKEKILYACEKCEDLFDED